MQTKMDIWDKIDALIENTNFVNLNTPKPTVKIPNGGRGNVKKIIITRTNTYVEGADKFAEKKIQNYLKIRTMSIMGYEIVTPGYWYDNNLCVPRFTAFLLKKKWPQMEIECTIVRQYPLDIQFIGKLTDNQQIVFDYVIAKFALDEARGAAGLIINMPAGQGKTFIGMALIGALKGRTLIVCHNENMLRQWGELLDKYITGNATDSPKIGYYYGKKKLNGDIVVCVINSIAKIDTNTDFFKFDMIIFDEVHQYCSKVRREIFKHCQSPWMVGLSATPDEREDGLDRFNTWNVGPIYNVLKPKEIEGQDKEFTCKVVRVKYYGPDEYCESILNEKLGLVSVPQMLTQLAEDPHRMDIAVKIIQELIERKRHIFVFADRRSYLENIQNLIKCESRIVTSQKEEQTVQLVGGSKREDVIDAIKRHVVILSTYQYGATGLSIPKMDSLVLLTPRKNNSKQICGRIFRLGGDNLIMREIYDIVDMRTTLKNQYYTRSKYYKENNFEVVDREFKYDDECLNSI
jgi:superfamily II DNA or RNA helicase